MSKFSRVRALPKPIAVFGPLTLLLCVTTNAISPAQAAAEASSAAHKTSTPSNLLRLFEGIASFYAEKFHGRRTASGARFDMNKMTCAHKTLPFGTTLTVKNLLNGKTCVVIVNDRGPYWGNRVLDLSKEAAHRIGITGICKVACYRGATTIGPIVVAKEDVKSVEPILVVPSGEMQDDDMTFTPQPEGEDSNPAQTQGTDSLENTAHLPPVSPVEMKLRYFDMPDASSLLSNKCLSDSNQKSRPQ